MSAKQSKMGSRENRSPYMLRDQRRGEGGGFRGAGEPGGVRLVEGNREVKEGRVELGRDRKIRRGGGARTLGQWTGQCR